MLTTHNRRARGINWDMLQQLDGDIIEYSASKSGWFPSDEYPTDYRLQLKVGARVMFVRNDTEDGEYVNGTLGVVKELNYSDIVVETDDKRRIYVRQQRWEHEQYKVNKLTKQLETEVTGSFTQFPLKLAWAVTIHKSQGMTFDHVVIDAQRAFTYGQVYVALSRCRSLSGIILMTELTPKTIKADEVVKQFMLSVKRVELTEENNESDNRYLIFNNPEDRTLFLINNGMSIDDIVEQYDEMKGVVYSHLAKLAAEGKINARDFVSFDVFASLHAIFLRYETDIDRYEVKKMCPSANYGEIELVRASISHQQERSGKSSVKRKETISRRNQEHAEAVTNIIYKRNVSFILSSKWFFNNTCRIVCNRSDGYFVNIYKTGMFVKIKELNGVAPTGSVWIKRPDSQGWSQIVHAVSADNKETVGYIKQAGGGLIFKRDLTQTPFMTIKVE